MSTPSWPSLYNPGIDLIDIPHHAPVQPGGAYLTHPLDIFRFTLYWTLIFYCPAFIFCGAFAFWNLNFPPAPRPHNARASPESRRPPKRGREPGSEEEEPFWPPSNSGAFPLSPLKPASAKPKPPPPPQPPPAALPPTSSSFPTSPTFRSTTPFLPRTDDDPSPHIINPPTPGHPADPSGSSTPFQSPGPPPAPKPKYQYKERERRTRFTFALLVLLTFLAAGLAGAVLGSAIAGFVAAAFFSSAHYHMSTWIPFLLAVIMVLLGYLSLWPSIIDII